MSAVYVKLPDGSDQITQEEFIRETGFEPRGFPAFTEIFWLRCLPYYGLITFDRFDRDFGWVVLATDTGAAVNDPTWTSEWAFLEGDCSLPTPEAAAEALAAALFRLTCGEE